MKLSNGWVIKEMDLDGECIVYGCGQPNEKKVYYIRSESRYIDSLFCEKHNQLRRSK